MTALAAQAQPTAEGLLFLPYLNGERTPYPDENARGVFFGLSYRHGLGEICRSVMEGVTYSLRDTIEILREFDVQVSEVRASGGGAKSELWRQMQADIFNAAVVTTNLEEGPSAGAAIMAAVGAGAYRTVGEACDSIVKIVSCTNPIAKNVAQYEEFYQTYRSLYPTLKSSFDSAGEARRASGSRHKRSMATQSPEHLMIEVKGLTKYYGDKPGVMNVSFCIESGEAVGLLGPNGAGKTTILKMLASQMLPAPARSASKASTRLPSRRNRPAEPGFLPEIPPLYPDMDVTSYLAFFAGVRGVPRRSAPPTSARSWK